MRALLIEMMRNLGLRYNAHDSHGFYLDVVIGERKLVVDPTPEDIWSKDERGRRDELLKRYPKGAVIVRDESHHYARPTQIAPDFDISTPEGVAALKAFLADTSAVLAARSRLSAPDVVTRLGELA